MSGYNYYVCEAFDFHEKICESLESMTDTQYKHHKTGHTLGEWSTVLYIIYSKYDVVKSLDLYITKFKVISETEGVQYWQRVLAYRGEPHVLEVARGQAAEAHLEHVLHLSDALALDAEVGVEVRLDGEEQLQLGHAGEQHDVVHAYTHPHEVEGADDEGDSAHAREDRAEPLAHHVQEAADAVRAAEGDGLAQLHLEGRRAHADLVGRVQDLVDDRAQVRHAPAQLALAQELPHQVAVLLFHPRPLLLEALPCGGGGHDPLHLLLHLLHLDEGAQLARLLLRGRVQHDRLHVLVPQVLLQANAVASDGANRRVLLLRHRADPGLAEVHAPALTAPRKVQVDALPRAPVPAQALWQQEGGGQPQPRANPRVGALPAYAGGRLLPARRGCAVLPALFAGSGGPHALLLDLHVVACKSHTARSLQDIFLLASV
eukprot:477387-Hanusia_phi.AAC.3